MDVFACVAIASATIAFALDATAADEFIERVPLDRLSLHDAVPRMAAAYVKEARRLQGLVDPDPSQSPERLLHEACSDAVRPLAAYLD